MILKRIEAYVLTRTLSSVAGALAVITSIIILIDVVEQSRNVGVRAEISFMEVLGLTLLRVPMLVLQLLPFVFLFGVLAAFVGLNRRSELIAMRAAGVSAWRFILPAAVAAFLIGVLTVTGANPLATQLNGRFEEVRAELLEGYLKDQPEEVWLSQGGGRNQVLLHAADRNEVGTELRDVTIRIYTRDERGGLVFNRRIDARRALLTDGAWILRDARVAIGGMPAVQTDSISIPTTYDARAVLERFASPQTVPFWELPDRIERTEAAGLSSLRYRLRLHQLLASPLMYAAMSILAAGFSLRLIRLGGIARIAGAGVALGFLFFFFSELCNAMGAAELLPPFAAAWAPSVLAFLAGLTLLSFTEDG